MSDRNFSGFRSTGLKLESASITALIFAFMDIETDDSGSDGKALATSSPNVEVLPRFRGRRPSLRSLTGTARESASLYVAWKRGMISRSDYLVAARGLSIHKDILAAIDQERVRVIAEHASGLQPQIDEKLATGRADALVKAFQTLIDAGQANAATARNGCGNAGADISLLALKAMFAGPGGGSMPRAASAVTPAAHSHAYDRSFIEPNAFRNAAGTMEKALAPESCAVLYSTNGPTSPIAKARIDWLAPIPHDASMDAATAAARESRSTAAATALIPSLASSAAARDATVNAQRPGAARSTEGTGAISPVGDDQGIQAATDAIRMLLARGPVPMPTSRAGQVL
jgi:hypothetical protein